MVSNQSFHGRAFRLEDTEGDPGGIVPATCPGFPGASLPAARARTRPRHAESRSTRNLRQHGHALPASTILLLFCLVLISARRAAAVSFSRGDVDGNGVLEITDPVRTLGYLFLGNPAELPCADAADSNDDGGLDIGDAVFTLTYLFSGGAAPPAPGGSCGEDPTADSLGCARFEPCDEDPNPGSEIWSTPSQPFVVQVSADRETGVPGTTFHLTAAPLDPDLDVVSYVWTASSGETGAGSNFLFSPSAPGTYFVQVEAADAGGNNSSSGIVLLVFDPEAPAPAVARSITPAEAFPGALVTVSGPALLDPAAVISIQVGGLPPLFPYRPSPGTANFLVPIELRDGLEAAAPLTVKVLGNGAEIDRFTLQVAPLPEPEGEPGDVLRGGLAAARAAMEELAVLLAAELARQGESADEIAVIRGLLELSTQGFKATTDELLARVQLLDSASLALLDQLLLAYGVDPESAGTAGSAIGDATIDTLCQITETLKRLKPIGDALGLAVPVLQSVALLGGVYAPIFQSVTLSALALQTSLDVLALIGDFLPSVENTLRVAPDRTYLKDHTEHTGIRVFASLKYEFNLCDKPYGFVIDLLKKKLAERIARRFPISRLVNDAVARVPSWSSETARTDFIVKAFTGLEEAVTKFAEKAVGLAQIDQALKNLVTQICARPIREEIGIRPENVVQLPEPHQAGSIGPYTDETGDFRPTVGFRGSVRIPAQRVCGSQILEGAGDLVVGDCDAAGRFLVREWSAQTLMGDCSSRKIASEELTLRNLLKNETITLVWVVQFDSACPDIPQARQVERLTFQPGEAKKLGSFACYDNCCGESFGEGKIAGVAVFDCPDAEGVLGPAEAYYQENGATLLLLPEVTPWALGLGSACNL